MHGSQLMARNLIKHHRSCQCHATTILLLPFQVTAFLYFTQDLTVMARDLLRLSRSTQLVAARVTGLALIGSETAFPIPIKDLGDSYLAGGRCVLVRCERAFFCTGGKTDLIISRGTGASLRMRVSVQVYFVCVRVCAFACLCMYAYSCAFL